MEEISAPSAHREAVKVMFENAMRGQWQEVAKSYAEDSVRVATIAQTGDTVLHLAVSSSVESNVKLLVDSVADGERGRDILGIKNERGDTPLHLAAALGMEEACRAMFRRCPELVIIARNEQGETPLFKAARHGRMKAFCAMQKDAIETLLNITEEGPRNLEFCRNFSGETMLHVALFGDHYELALKITEYYPELVNYCNEKGESPLHILANKPSAFKSGAHFSPLEKLIYHAMDLVPTYSNYRQKQSKNSHSILTSVKSKFWSIVHLFYRRPDSIRSTNPQDVEGQTIPVLERQGNKDQASPKNPVALFKWFRFPRRFLPRTIEIGQRIKFIKIMEQNRTHGHAHQIMKTLLQHRDEWDFGRAGKNPSIIRNDWLNLEPSQIAVGHLTPDVMEQENEQGSKNESEQPKPPTPPMEGPVGETPFLVAAKNGIEELVESILKRFPVALLDLDTNEKNILLLAVEHRQSNIYELLRKRKEMQQSVFRKVDSEGNSAVHLAAKLGPIPPQIIPGAALGMQWEVKWFKYVERSMDPDFFPRYNHKGESAREIFTETHEALVKEGGDWLTKTSQSCSVVAALIATVAFATASSLPGGVNQSTGFPLFQGQKGFHVFATFALVALCFSVTSLVMFLSFLTSRYEQWRFETDLPLKLILNLTSLFFSIAAMLISFCAAHFYVIKNQFKQVVYSYVLYAIVCLPVFFFAMLQFPLYVGLIRATFARVPARAVSGP